MKRNSMIDKEYIVIRIRVDALRHLIQLAAALAVILPYPLLLLFSPIGEGPSAFAPFSLAYAVLAPALLAFLSSRAMSGAPADGRFCVLCVLWHVACAGLIAAGLVLEFAHLSPPPADACVLLRAALYSTAGLWLFEAVFSDLLGDYFWAGYFFNAGSLVTLYDLLRILHTPDAELSFRSAAVRSVFFPLAAGALLCVILLLALLLQMSSQRGARRRGRY